MTSQPCLNGGTCIPQYFTVNSSRFTCRCTKYYRGKKCQECAEGYTGHLCQTPIKSCRAYKNENEVVREYKIFDNNMKLFPVMCQYEKNRAWTLIHSFRFDNHERTGMKSSLASNAELEKREDDPNLQIYRMSKFRMQGVAEDSVKWRITCDYRKTNAISYTDYVEASLQNVNILTFNGNR